MSSLPGSLLVKVLRPLGRALIVYGMIWVRIPDAEHEELMTRDSFPREDSYEYLSLLGTADSASKWS
jgi:hypothetical protein